MIGIWLSTINSFCPAVAASGIIPPLLHPQPLLLSQHLLFPKTYPAWSQPGTQWRKEPKKVISKPQSLGLCFYSGGNKIGIEKYSIHLMKKLKW